MKGPLLLLAVMQTFSALAQDTAWTPTRIDDNFQLSLPGKIVKIDTTLYSDGAKKVAIYKAGFPTLPIGVSMVLNKTGIEADNQGVLKEFYSGMEESYRKKAAAAGMLCAISDTALDGISGKKVRLFYDSSESADGLFLYSFLVNGNVYAITAYVSGGSVSEGWQTINKMLSSVHFKKTSLQERRFGSGIQSTAYRLGKLTGKLLFLGVIVFAVIYYVRRSARRQNPS